MTVAILGDQVVDLAAAQEGDTLVVQDDGTLLPGPRLLAPIRVVASAGLSVGVTANAWHDTDPGGSAAARPLDIVIPDVRAGQWICVSPEFMSGAGVATQVYMDMWTIVAAAPVNQFGAVVVSNVGGIAPWTLITSVRSQAQAPCYYQVQQADIEDGSVRCRLRDFNTTTTARTISGAGGVRAALYGLGPFG